MVFSSFVFLFIFIPVLFVIYFAVPARYREARNGVLLLFSLVFYAYGGIMFLPLMILSILINYTFGLLVSPERGAQARKISLIPSVVLNLGLLGYFKYAGFFAENLNRIGFSMTVPILCCLPGSHFLPALRQMLGLSQVK